MESKISSAGRSTVRVLYLGLHGVFSRVPLKRLLAEGVDICGIVVPGDGAVNDQVKPIHQLLPGSRVGELPLVNPYVGPSIVHLGWETGVPVFQVAAATAPETLAMLGTLRPDVACVACYDRMLPPALLAVPPQGFLNLHPSLLPKYRGPHPIFWSLQQGEAQLGVTLHLMDRGLDTGDIVSQIGVAVEDGLSFDAIEERLADAGAGLMIKAIDLLARGDLPRRAQPPGGSYQPAPNAADFGLDLTWTARHAFNFMRGTAHWGRTYPLVVAGKQLHLRYAVDYDPAASQEQALSTEGALARIRFSRGVLLAK